MAPVIDTLFINRPTHLLGTGGAYWAIILEETQTAVFERQAALGQQTPDLVFGIFDHIFVMYAVDATGQRLIEMRH